MSHSYVEVMREKGFAVVYRGLAWGMSSVSVPLAWGKNSAFAELASLDYSAFAELALVKNSAVAKYVWVVSFAFARVWVRNCAFVRLVWGSVAFAGWTETWVFGWGLSASGDCVVSKYRMAGSCKRSGSGCTSVGHWPSGSLVRSPSRRFALLCSTW